MAIENLSARAALLAADYIGQARTRLVNALALADFMGAPPRGVTVIPATPALDDIAIVEELDQLEFSLRAHFTACLRDEAQAAIAAQFVFSGDQP